MDDCQIISLLIAFFILLCLAIHILKQYVRENFVSKEAVELYQNSEKLLSKDDRISYTDFKNKTGIKDIVIYDDIKKLHKKGDLSPEKVQSIIG